MSTRSESLAETLSRLAQQQPQGVSARPAAVDRSTSGRPVVARPKPSELLEPLPRERIGARTFVVRAVWSLLAIAAAGLVLGAAAYELFGEGAEARYGGGMEGFLLIAAPTLVCLALYLLVRTARFLREHIHRPGSRRSSEPRSAREDRGGLPT